MNIKNLKHYIIVIAILFGISPFVTSIYANINLFQMTSLVPNNDDEEDEEDEDEDEEEEDDEDEEEDEDEDEDEEDDEEDEEDDEEAAVNDSIAQVEEIVITDKDGHEDIIEVPEGMVVNLDEVLKEYNAQQYLQMDTTCRMSDENPTYSQDVYVDRLKRMPTAIEMPWNDVVQKFIDRYSGRLRRSVSYMLGASNFYMPIFEQALEVYGLPLELKYLPVIESALNPNAISPVGAGGLWQFMNATGKRYGLKINSMIDERRDAVKASYAAAHYLSDL